MRLISRHVVLIHEATWNFEYNTLEEFINHREVMKQEGVLVNYLHTSKNGKLVATYTRKVEEDYSECSSDITQAEEVGDLNEYLQKTFHGIERN